MNDDSTANIGSSPLKIQEDRKRNILKWLGFRNIISLFLMVTKPNSEV